MSFEQSHPEEHSTEEQINTQPWDGRGRNMPTKHAVMLVLYWVQWHTQHGKIQAINPMGCQTKFCNVLMCACHMQLSRAT